MAITLSAFCLAILTVSILGGLLPLATVLNHTRLQVYLSFSAGTMLGAAFFHMMPEAIRLGSVGTIHWAAFGLLGLFFLERFFSFHHHESPADATGTHSEHDHAGHAHHQPGADCTTMDSANAASPGTARAVRALPWGSAAFGLVIHSLIGGVALASAVAADYRLRAGLGRARLGRFHRDLGPQARGRPDDHLAHAPRRLDPLLGSSDEFRFRGHDPGGSRLFRFGDGRHRLPYGVVVDGRGARFLGRHILVHCAFGPPARTPVPFS